MEIFNHSQEMLSPRKNINTDLHHITEGGNKKAHTISIYGNTVRAELNEEHKPYAFISIKDI